MEIPFTEILLSETKDHIRSFVELTPRLFGAVVVIVIGWLLARGLRWMVGMLGHRYLRREALTEVLQMLTGAFVWITIAFVSAAVIFPSVTPADVLTALGVGSIAIGFAFKDIFENFFAGILILLREPFEIGDFIECEGVEGAVERISVRETRVRQTDGQLMVVPNAQLFQNAVLVRTNMSFRRTEIICGVAYGCDVDEARDIIQDAVQKVDSVRDDVRDVQVFAHEFSASSVDFEIAWWTGSRPIDIRTSRDEVIRAIKRALDSAGIEIPFPQRTLTIASGEQDAE